MAKFDLKEYARLGAQARVQELQAELAEIYRTFPGLRTGRRGATAAAKQSPSGTARRKRRTMTAAQKREVSQRMKRYWAARRKAQEAKR